MEILLGLVVFVGFAYLVYRHVKKTKASRTGIAGPGHDGNTDHEQSIK